METFSGEVTLYDLIAWESRLHAIAPQPEGPHWRSLTSIEVDWVVTARSSQPMLPTLRGGELIILPERIIKESGVSFGTLIRQLAQQPVAGVLTDHAGSIDLDISTAILQISVVDTELERDLNRIITSGRRQALQHVAELDQAIAVSSAQHARPSDVMERMSSLLGVPITVHTPGQTVLFTTGSSHDVPDATSDSWLQGVLRSGYSVWLGPISPANHALARFSIRHVRDALQQSLDSSSMLNPRGNARAAALNALLSEPLGTGREKLVQQAHLAGVRTDRLLRVALSSDDVTESQIRRSFQYVGDALEAGDADGSKLWLVVDRATAPVPGRLTAPTDGWVVASATVPDPGDLPEAMRQARFLGVLMKANILSSRAVAFDDHSALGVHSLLYRDWESKAHREYRDFHLKPLMDNDPRGLLIETLGVYLDQQGSQSHASEALGIHRNTLSYRLRQIESALPVDLSDAHTRLTLHIAITIHRVITL